MRFLIQDDLLYQCICYWDHETMPPGALVPAMTRGKGLAGTARKDNP